MPLILESGATVRLKTLDNDEVTVEGETTDDLRGTLMGCVLMHKGDIIAVDTFRMEGRWRKNYNRAALPAGVSQITVFGGNGMRLAERLFFICPMAKEQDSIHISSRTSRLTPCCKVSFNIRTEPNSSISFSAIDAATINNGWEGNMKTWTLLASEVRGYIDHPEYYFEADDDKHRRDADMLMMIQGWRRYDFRQMAGVTEFERKQPIEDKLYLFGQVKSKRKKFSPDDVEITATMYNRKGEVIDGKLKTDSLGKYNYIVPDVEGEWTLFMKSKKDDEARDYYIGIDRHY